MMFIVHGDDYVSGRGLSFRQWMEDGIDGRFPGWDDWETHLTQVFPEVRVKKQIEIRKQQGEVREEANEDYQESKEQQ